MVRFHAAIAAERRSNELFTGLYDILNLKKQIKGFRLSKFVKPGFLYMDFPACALLQIGGPGFWTLGFGFSPLFLAPCTLCLLYLFPSSIFVYSSDPRRNLNGIWVAFSNLISPLHMIPSLSTYAVLLEMVKNTGTGKAFGMLRG
jgi:hypothetical protein